LQARSITVKDNLKDMKGNKAAKEQGVREGKKKSSAWPNNSIHFMIDNNN
jgi:hypothetical protein